MGSLPYGRRSHLTHPAPICAAALPAVCKSFRLSQPAGYRAETKDCIYAPIGASQPGTVGRELKSNKVAQTAAASGRGACRCPVPGRWQSAPCPAPKEGLGNLGFQADFWFLLFSDKRNPPPERRNILSPPRAERICLCGASRAPPPTCTIPLSLQGRPSAVARRRNIPSTNPYLLIYLCVCVKGNPPAFHLQKTEIVLYLHITNTSHWGSL